MKSGYATKGFLPKLEDYVDNGHFIKKCAMYRKNYNKSLKQLSMKSKSM